MRRNMKRFVAFCLCFSLFLTFSGMVLCGASETESVDGASAIYRGDVDANGEIDLKDVLSLRKSLAGMLEIKQELGDANGDNFVDMKDVLFLRKYIAGMGGTLIPIEVSEEEPDITTTTKAEEPSTTIVTKPGETTTSTTHGVTVNPTSSPKYEISHDDPHIDFIKKEGITLGTWIWNFGSTYEPSRTILLDLFEKNQVTEMYLSCAGRMMSSGGRQEIHSFAAEATKRGIRLDVLYDDQSLRGNSLLNTAAGIKNYYNEYPDDLVGGINCDVEPTKGDKTNTATWTNWCTKYVTYFLQDVIAVQENYGIDVSLDLGCNWGGYGRDLKYKGPITAAYEENRHPEMDEDGYYTMDFNDACANACTRIVAMSYRDTAPQIISFANSLRKAADRAETPIVYGVETMDAGEGDKVSFFEESKEELYTELSRLLAYLDRNPPKGSLGLAIHHAVSWNNLREQKVPETTTTTEA